MEEAKARDLITALANGVHPVTGELLASESVLQTTEVVRALMCAARALESRGAGRSERSALPANAGKPWSGDEDDRLLAAFEAGRTLKEMAELHGRTVAGVEARLERLGRLDPDARTTPRRYPVRSDGQRTPSRRAD